uniref:Uncharacterized protein n=1 Tax=Anopheles atroparvus TaxID=41427 RepID=A0A182JFW3_ANOAO
MPLCTTTNAFESSERCGCELSSLGAPCVAQRVCAMPTCDSHGSLKSIVLAASRMASSSTFTLPQDAGVGRDPVDGDARRVVATVLEPLQPVQQQLQHVAARLRREEVETDLELLLHPHKVVPQVQVAAKEAGRAETTQEGLLEALHQPVLTAQQLPSMCWMSDGRTSGRWMLGLRVRGGVRHASTSSSLSTVRGTS